MDGDNNDEDIIPSTPPDQMCASRPDTYPVPVVKSTLYNRRKRGPIAAKGMLTPNKRSRSLEFKFTPLEVRCSMEKPEPALDLSYSLFSREKQKEVPILEQFGVQEDGERVVCSIHSYFPYLNIEVAPQIQYKLVEKVLCAWLDAVVIYSTDCKDVQTCLQYAEEQCEDIDMSTYTKQTSKKEILDSIAESTAQYPMFQSHRQGLIEHISKLSGDGGIFRSFFKQIDLPSQSFFLFCLYSISLRAIQHSLTLCTRLYAESIGEALNRAYQVYAVDPTLQSIVAIHQYTAHSTFGYTVHPSTFLRISVVNPMYLKPMARILQSGSCLGHIIQPYSVHIENYVQCLQDQHVNQCTTSAFREIMQVKKNKFTTKHVHTHAYHVSPLTNAWKQGQCGIVRLHPETVLSTLEIQTSKCIVSSQPCFFPFKAIDKTPKLILNVQNAKTPWKTLLPRLQLKQFRRVIQYITKQNGKPIELPETPRKQQLQKGISLGGYYDAAQKRKMSEVAAKFSMPRHSIDQLVQRYANVPYIQSSFAQAVEWIEKKRKLTKHMSMHSVYSQVTAVGSAGSSKNMLMNLQVVRNSSVNRVDSMSSTGEHLEDDVEDEVVYNKIMKKRKTFTTTVSQHGIDDSKTQTTPVASLDTPLKPIKLVYVPIKVHAKRTSQRGEAYFCDLGLGETQTVKKQKWLPKRLVPELLQQQFQEDQGVVSSIDISEDEESMQEGRSIAAQQPPKPAVTEDTKCILTYQQECLDALHKEDALHTADIGTKHILTEMGPSLYIKQNTGSFNGVIRVYAHNPVHRLAYPYLDPILYIGVYFTACNANFEETYKELFLLQNASLLSNTLHIPNTHVVPCSSELDQFTTLLDLILTRDVDELIGFDAKSSFWYLQTRYAWLFPGNIPFLSQQSRQNRNRIYSKQVLEPIPYKQNVQYCKDISEHTSTRVLLDNSGATHILPVSSGLQEYVHRIGLSGKQSDVASVANTEQRDDIYGRSVRYVQDCYDAGLGQGEDGSLRELVLKHLHLQLFEPMNRHVSSPYTAELVAVETYMCYLLYKGSEQQPRTCQMASMMGIRPTDVLKRGSQLQVEGLLERFVRSNGFVSPSMSATQVKEQAALEAQALNRDPESYSAYYDPVAVFDYRSLYPSVMIAYNMCYSTCLGSFVSKHDGPIYIESPLHSQLNSMYYNMNGNMDSLGVLEYTRILQETKLGGLPYLRDWSHLLTLQDNILITTSGCMFVHESVKRGLFPRMQAEVQYTRLHLKRMMKQSQDSVIVRRQNLMQHAQKQAAAVSYGYVSASFTGRMPCAEIADSIVQTGRDILEYTCKQVDETDTSNQKIAYKVVYGDTDSLFVRFFAKDNASSPCIDTAYTQAIKFQANITESQKFPVHLELEKIYAGLLLQTKKRYVGYKYNTPQATPELEAKGLEVMRKDQCPLTAEVLQKMLLAQFETRDLMQCVSTLRNEMSNIQQYKTKIADFIFARNVRFGKYSVHKTPPPAAALVARQCTQDIACLPFYKDRIQYLFVRAKERDTQTIFHHVLLHGTVHQKSAKAKKHTVSLSHRVVSKAEYMHAMYHSNPHDIHIDVQYYVYQQIQPAAFRLQSLLPKNSVHPEANPNPTALHNYIILKSLRWGASILPSVQRLVTTQIHRSNKDIGADKSILTSTSVKTLPINSNSAISLIDQLTHHIPTREAPADICYIDRKHNIPALTPLLSRHILHYNNSLLILNQKLSPIVQGLLHKYADKTNTVFQNTREYMHKFQSTCFACYAPMHPLQYNASTYIPNIFVYQQPTHVKTKLPVHFSVAWCVLFIYFQLYPTNLSIPQPISLCTQCVYIILSKEGHLVQNPFSTITEIQLEFQNILIEHLKNIQNKANALLITAKDTCIDCISCITPNIVDIECCNMSCPIQETRNQQECTLVSANFVLDHITDAYDANPI